MATKKLTELTAGIPEASDIFYVVKDPSGTPLDRKITISALSSLLGTSGDANAVAFFNASGDLDSNTGLTFSTSRDPNGSGPLSFDLNLQTMAAGDGYPGGISSRVKATSINVMSSFAGLIGAQVSAEIGASIVDVREVIGGSFTARTSSALDDGIGLSVDTIIDTAVAVSALYGATIRVQVNTGTVTDAIALNIQNVAGATNNYAIKTGTGMVDWGDFMQMTEQAAPAAPAANKVRIYAKDTGGKTELLALFSSGAAQRLAIEP